MTRPIVVLLCLCLLIAGNLFAQPDKVMQANRALEDYRKDKNRKDLFKAQDLIDKAMMDQSARALPNAWMIRGDIYMQLYAFDYEEKKKKQANPNSDSTRNNLYRIVADSLLNLASMSYVEAQRLDTAGKIKDQLRLSIIQCIYQNTAAGSATYTEKHATISMNCFYRNFLLQGAIGTYDTASLYNATMAGMKASQFSRAITWAKTLVTFNYEGVISWWMLGQCYVQSGDTLNARLTINDGLKRYPENAALKYTLIDIHLASGNIDAADEIAGSYTTGGPLTESEENAQIGSVYDQLANPSDPYGIPKEKPFNWELLMGRAEIYYKKAIDLNPGYFDARYSLAVMYYNAGAYYYNKSIESDAPNEYDQKWPDYIRKATVEFEAVKSINSRHRETLMALKTCYAQLGETEKYLEVKKEIEDL